MKRKKEHVEIALSQKVQGSHNFWQDISFVHNSLPEINKEDVNLKTEFFGRYLNFPFIIASMTGGYEEAIQINENLARAAEKLGIGFGIGSERALFKNDFVKSYTVVRKYKIPVKMANLGAPQLIDQKGEEALNLDEIEEAVKIIDANFLAIHLNFLQEIVQPGGETRAKGIINAIGKVVSSLDVPVIVKETGGGISRNCAERLKSVGVECIDVGGTGGTSFAAIEQYRAKAMGSDLLQHMGRVFWNWGIPSPISVGELRNQDLKIVASGGIRSGLDVARAIASGADLASAAYPFLSPATKGYKEVIALVEVYMEEFRNAMFLLGVEDVRALKNVKTLTTGRLYEWGRGMKNAGNL